MILSLSSLIEQLKAAAEPTRLRLLTVCAAGEMTVSELTRIVGQSQPRVSRHLRILCNAGLLMRFREQHFVFYRVPAAGDSRTMVDTLLGSLDVDDTVVARDHAARERVLRERAERARQVLADGAWDVDLCDPRLSDEVLNSEILFVMRGAKTGDLLDIGTGTGRILALLGPEARSAVGVDISSDMLLVARSNVQAAGLDTVMVRHADMYRLPYPDASFDTITVDQVLARAERPARVLIEAARLLRPDGRLLVVDVDSRDHESCPPQLSDWANAAGLSQEQVRHIEGDSVDVVVSLLRCESDSENEAA